MPNLAKITAYAAPIPTRLELERDFRASGRTSIARKTASAPLKILLAAGMIKGSVLNYGKGRCDTDSLAITAAGFQCTDYDFTWSFNPQVLGSSFTTVYAGYVTNTLPPASRAAVWREIAKATRLDGCAFVAARSNADRGIKGVQFEDGVITSIGTFQKGYMAGELIAEALQYFKYVESLKGKAGFRIVKCSHSPIN
ncbi:hypothetical protein Sbal625DRAFT_4143 [Shewanella baltica OS625]|uniref:hypothetical protein n=1 Tax=Shewanella baltica TaxID=62322 RepID=UPI000230DD53|nr:hypothetical protein [Shewanella baltica]EHC04183.1 hypothetical protein Sbal625DRAFT_4143 [Shewanella baltica OS625]